MKAYSHTKNDPNRHKIRALGVPQQHTRSRTTTEVVARCSKLENIRAYL